MWRATLAVIDYSHAKLAARCVLMNIAEEADWPTCEVVRSDEYFAEKLHISVRQFQRHIAALEQLGELICDRKPGLKTRWIIPLLPGEPDRVEAEKQRKEKYKQIEASRRKPAATTAKTSSKGPLGDESHATTEQLSAKRADGAPRGVPQPADGRASAAARQEQLAAALASVLGDSPPGDGGSRPHL